jgi:hypothetical protein
MENASPKISEKIQKKACTSCGLEKALSDFPIDRHRRDGHREQCKACREQVKRAWKLSHTENVKAYNKKSRENHRGYRKAYCKKNPEIIKNARRNYVDSHRNDPKTILHRRISGGVRRGLASGKAGRSWESLVGYTLAQLRRHLEKHFLPGMTWENMGKWHIDHKIPVSAFNFTAPDDIDFRKCWALKNLQPLWARDNEVKNAHLERPHQPSLAIGE